MQDLEIYVPGFEYADMNTWHYVREKTRPTHGVIIQQFGFGWLQSVVDVRTHPKIVSLFRELWGQHSLFSSADALSVSLMPLPARQSKSSRAGYHRENADWLHWDRSPADKQQSYQGFLNLKDVESDLGSTFCFLRGSHKKQSAFQAEFLADKTLEEERNPRFYLLSNQRQYDFFAGCEYFALKLKPGDFVLWDSRVVHQGRGPVFKATTDVALERCVVYASYQPTSYATLKDVQKKRKAFATLSTTTHNASCGVSMFSKKPRLYSKADVEKMRNRDFAVPVMTAPKLTAEAKQFFGLV